MFNLEIEKSHHDEERNEGCCRTFKSPAFYRAGLYVIALTSSLAIFFSCLIMSYSAYQRQESVEHKSLDASQMQLSTQKYYGNGDG